MPKQDNVQHKVDLGLLAFAAGLSLLDSSCRQRSRPCIAAALASRGRLASQSGMVFGLTRIFAAFSILPPSAKLRSNHAFRPPTLEGRP